jgi:hypothetical protein
MKGLLKKFKGGCSDPDCEDCRLEWSTESVTSHIAAVGKKFGSALGRIFQWTK